MLTLALALSSPGAWAACPGALEAGHTTGPSHWHADLRCAEAAFAELRTDAGHRPGPTASVERRGLEAERTDVRHALDAVAAELDQRAADRARGDRTEPDAEVDDAPLVAERTRLETRLAQLDGAIAALPEDASAGGPGADEVVAVARLYARLQVGIDTASGPMRPDELCAVWGHGAVAARMAGEPDAVLAMANAAGLYGDPCAAELGPLLADPGVAVLWADAERAAGSTGFVDVDLDDAAWYLDGAELWTREGGVEVGPGLHRVDRAEDGPAAHATFELAPGERARLEWDGARIRVRPLPPTGEGWATRGDARPDGEMVGVGPVRPYVGAGWAYPSWMGFGGASVRISPRAAPRWGLDVRGGLGISSAPVYLTRFEATHVLPRADLSVQFALAPRSPLDPRLSLGGFGELGVTAGPRLAGSVALRVGGGTIEVGAALPWALVGPASGPGFELFVSPLPPRSGRSASETP